MKSFPTRILSYLLILTVFVNCSEEAVKPKVVVDKPVPNLTNCRISREVVKTWYDGPNKEDSEVIVIDGKPFTVGVYTRTRYTYDAQGRIVREDNERRPEFWVTYTYAPATIVKTIRGNSPNGVLENFITTIPLSGQGLDARKKYDIEGYPLDSVYADGRPTSKRINGNWVEAWGYGSDITIKTTFQYDTTKTNLPNKYPFYGKLNKNLETSSVAEVVGGFYSWGELYRNKNYYEFDTYGRVKRRIVYFQRTYKGPYMPYVLTGLRIEVTDFEYECP